MVPQHAVSGAPLKYYCTYISNYSDNNRCYDAFILDINEAKLTSPVKHLF